MATFELLHGAWHTPSCWALLEPELRARGHDVVAPELPLGNPAASYEERAQPAVEALDGIAGPVVIVGHSMAAAYAALAAHARPDSTLVHLCSSLGPWASLDGAPETFRPGRPAPESRPDGTYVWDPDEAVRKLYARVPDDTARAAAERLVPMAPAPGEFPLPGHPDVATALVYAADDEFFQPDWERFMARELLGVEPVELPGGHFPMLEDPAGLSAVLARFGDV